MKNRTLFRFAACRWTTWVAGLLLWSCSDRDTPLSPPVRKNQLATSAVPDTTTLSVDAEGFNREGTQPGYFGTHLYTVTLSVTGWAGGPALLRVRDLGGTLLHQDSVWCDTSISCTLAHLTAPWALEYSFHSFTGRLDYRMEREGGGTGDYPASAYPTDPGCWWQYAVFSGDAPVDTVTISVERDTLLPGGEPATLWHFRGASWGRDALSTWNGDTLTVAFTEGVLWPPLRLVFPITPGRIWMGIGDPRDVFLVDSIQAIRVPASPLDHAFVVRHVWGEFPERGDLVHWFVPGIGMAKAHVHIVGLSYTNQDWELIATHLPRRRQTRF